MVWIMFAVGSHVSLDQQHRFKGGVGAVLLHWFSSLAENKLEFNKRVYFGGVLGWLYYAGNMVYLWLLVE